MPNQVNYKQKYEDLKMKYMQDVDTAYRLGFEQGSVQAQQDQMMQQQQQQQEMDQAAAGQQPGMGGGSEGSPAGAEQQANPNGGGIEDVPDSENPAGSELDQHIAKLESMVSKSETSPEDLKKAVSELQSLRKSMESARQIQVEMKKSTMAISGIAKALHKPAFKIGKQASHNMSDNAKKAVGMQEKIVSDLMKAMDDEEKKAATDITKILGVEGLTKKV